MDPLKLDHNSRVPELIVANSVLLVAATIAVGLRFYTRVKIARFIGADDWWMLAAWAFALGQFTVWTLYDLEGNGQHAYDLDPGNLTHFYIILWVVQLIYPIGTALIKISILALYKRLFPSDRFRLILYLTMGFIAAMTTAVFLATLLECTPIAKNWEFTVWNSPFCVDRNRLQYAVAGLAFGTDIVVLLLPMKYLICLNVALRDRIQVIALMSLGSVACIASIVRFKYIGVVGHSQDPTWDGFYLSIWSTVEFHLAIIAACVPAIKPLFILGMRRLLHRGKISHGDSSVSSSNYSNHATRATRPEISMATTATMESLSSV